MKPILALDADGVLVDLHQGYARAWELAFGTFPAERDPQAYWPVDRWAVPRLEDAQRERLREAFRADSLWEKLPALPGAVAACHRLHDAGYQLVCVTALEDKYQAARLRNLRGLGFPIERVITTGHHEGERSPKADAIAALNPVAFADDYIAYMRGLPAQVHAALILRAPHGSPNQGPDMAWAKSQHEDLAAFAEAWLTSPQWHGPHGAAA